MVDDNLFCVRSRKDAGVLQKNPIILENYATLPNVTQSILEVTNGVTREIDKLPMKCSSSTKSLSLDVILEGSIRTSVERATVSLSPQKHKLWQRQTPPLAGPFLLLRSCLADFSASRHLLKCVSPQGLCPQRNIRNGHQHTIQAIMKFIF